MNGSYQTHSKIVTKVNRKLRPYYRPNTYNNKPYKSDKLAKINEWYTKSKGEVSYSSVMFVPVTPTDRLLKIFKQIEIKQRIGDNERIKFVSMSDMKLSDLIQTRDPFSSNCEDVKCTQSAEANVTGKTINCKKCNICYMVECKSYKSKGIRRVYYGETSRNLHVRSMEHYRDC